MTTSAYDPEKDFRGTEVKRDFYEVSCVCGRIVAVECHGSVVIVSRCPSCKRFIRIDWTPLELPVPVIDIMNLKQYLRSRPTPREDPAARRERLETMRVKKQIREAS